MPSIPWTARAPRLLFLALLLPSAALPALAAPHTDRLAPPDPYGLAQRSAIVLERANGNPREAMPLGNGQLGAAVWAENGMTIQLNRADTLPGRLSPGQLVLPGLKPLAGASDYQGRLDLATGEFTEQGAGMRATAFLESGTDALVVSVTGCDPAKEQTAELRLWQPRKPLVAITQADPTQPRLVARGVLSETWQDVGDAGASGETFGSLAAITAEARDLRIEASGSLAIRLRFHPRADGSFRVVVAAPAWSGGDPGGLAAQSLDAALAEPASVHRDWWRAFWNRATPVALHSANGEAEYLAQLRTIYLYTAAAEVGSNFPGSNAGVGDLFSSLRDAHQWDPAAYWHWNLRMLVAANLGAGVPELNRSYFALYRENVPALLAWTRQHMGGRAGVCVPETMRFNGKGYENESWNKSAAINCGEDSPPLWNARTLSTGEEVSLWIWRQYLATDDRAFLEANYPVMLESARFLLAYSTRDSAGIVHTAPANAHENQWDVRDPLTNLLAMRVVFAETAAAADLLHRDTAVAAQLRDAVEHLPPLPLVDPAQRGVLLTGEALVAAGDRSILADSYEPGAELHNVENLGLEAVWPYAVIGSEPADPLHALGLRTFAARLQKNEADWSYDPLQAAHLGLGEQVRTSLLALTERYQRIPSGMAGFIGPDFFVEQIGVLSAALDDSLAQQAEAPDSVLVPARAGRVGVAPTLRILVAPALPSGWDGDGTVALAHGVRVRVLFHAGRVTAVAIEPGSCRRLTVQNPWPGKKVRVALRGRASRLLPVGSILTLDTVPGAELLLAPSDAAPPQGLTTPAPQGPRQLGTRTIGLFLHQEPVTIDRP